MPYRGVPTVRKRLAGASLRRIRESRGQSIEDVAKLLGVSRSAVYRQETGHTATSVADARAYLEMYEVEDEKVIERVLALARFSRVRGWWFAYGDTAGEEHVDLADAEDIATEIRIVSINYLHALLENDEYAKASIDAGRGLLTAHGLDPEAALDLRRARRSILEGRDSDLVGKNPPILWCVIGEASLHTEFSDPAVMAKQIDHLIELGDRPNISIQILPSSSTANVMVSGFMTILSIDGTVDGSVVHTANSFSDDPDQIKKDSHRFTHIQTQALSRDETRKYLQRLAGTMRSV